MVAQMQLPPSERDFLAYQLVKVEAKSTRQAAEAIGISQTRVCQVVSRVASFLLDVAPLAEDDHRKAQQLHVGRQIATERLDFLYGLAVHSFRDSQGEQAVVREVESLGQPRVTSATMRTSAGETRYLATAARIALLASKVSAPGLTASIAPATPSAEDCSAETLEPTIATTSNARKSVASPAEDITSSFGDAADLFSEILRARPVQQGDLISARHVENQASSRPLSRRERRARRAQLKRAS